MTLDKDSFLQGLAIVVKGLLTYPGMTQEQFEHQTKISQATISKILAKDYQDFPKIRVLNLLSEYMGIQLSELISQIELNSGAKANQFSPDKSYKKLTSEINHLTDEQAVEIAFVALTRYLENKQ